jgi:hypothetical protein
MPCYLSPPPQVYEAQGVVDAMLRPRGSDKDKRARVMEAGQQDAHEFIQVCKVRPASRPPGGPGLASSVGW